MKITENKENNNVTVYSQEEKVYYPILKNPEEVTYFVESCRKCIDAYPKYIEQLNELALHKMKWFREDYIEGLYNEIHKLSGTVRFTIRYAKAHAKDGVSQLAGNPECMNALKKLSKDIQHMEKMIDFGVFQAETLYAFRSLAGGINPNDDSLEVDTILEYVDLESKKAQHYASAVIKPSVPLDDTQKSELLDKVS
ncbi:MAG: hypothetical protein LUK37_03655 [Clostridia bacterium]|nr:hypothetical protein [Clostridia bacterium]